MYPDIASNKPAIKNTQYLWADIQISWGNIPNILAKVAPAPSDTNRAGNAQHSKVDVEPNRLNIRPSRLIHGRFMVVNSFNIKARVGYHFGDGLIVNGGIGCKV